MPNAVYLKLTRRDLEERARRAVAALGSCRACPRECGADRLAGRWGACKTGRYAVVSSAFPHMGEEDCLRGTRGSGTIFFAHCNLRCVFCQNFDISQMIRPDAFDGHSPEEIARAMLALQARGCHNINFVTPEHVVPQVLEALLLACAGGLSVPLVYNTGAYDAMESLHLLDGVFDIYMPDFKFWTRERSQRYLRAEDYPAVARRAILEMHRQVGPLQINDEGVAVRGVLIRHLVLPGMLDETKAILRWVARELGTDTYVNLMDQYHPAGKVSATRFAEIDRRLTSGEYLKAREMAADLGLRRLDERAGL